ncbi:MAG TPA: hypothetical protein VHW09_31945 [Bryobacteraceae bacterium]|nr:hypothetical protein [Bryobacteraceae bacterium]
MKLILSAAALLGVLAHLSVAQVAVLHIQVIEGEGAVNAAGSHNSRPLAIEVTDETGKPVEGASVSFHLPEEGPGGTFGNSLRTDVTATDARGRANLHTMILNRTPGRFAIRIVASKEQARAGMVSFQYIAEPGNTAAAAASSHSGKPFLHGSVKWVVLGALAAGAGAAGAILAGKSGTAAATAAAPATGTATSTGISIGAPALTVGKP